MRKIYFLFPRLTNINAGGHLAQVKLLQNTRQFCTAEQVTYETREANTLFLDELLADESAREAIFFIHWGPHIPALLERLQGRNVVYVAYSTGYGFQLPAGVPVFAGSRHAQSYWGKYAPNAPIFYVPCEISENFRNLGLTRDIDVLVQKRKSSRYLLEQLVPALQPHCSVFVIDSWVEDLALMFNRSKVYLYDSSEFWAQAGVSEGFGLPPLEAMACGCSVFSSLNDALSDYLEPGSNCQQLRVYSTEYDIERILQVVKNWQAPAGPDPAREYRQDKILARLENSLHQLNEFFDHRAQHAPDIPEIGLMPREMEVRLLREQLTRITNSRSWQLFERLRGFYWRMRYK
jgi:hypothetical protein